MQEKGAKRKYLREKEIIKHARESAVYRRKHEREFFFFKFERERMQEKAWNRQRN